MFIIKNNSRNDHPHLDFFTTFNSLFLLYTFKNTHFSPHLKLEIIYNPGILEIIWTIISNSWVNNFFYQSLISILNDYNRLSRELFNHYWKESDSIINWRIESFSQIGKISFSNRNLWASWALPLPIYSPKRKI